MAGRSRKTNIVRDISEISVPETKEISPEMESIIEKAEIAPEPSNYNTGIVKTDSWLNVRSSPSFSAPIVGKLGNGEKVDIYETKDGFGKISITESKWVSLKFIV